MKSSLQQQIINYMIGIPNSLILKIIHYMDENKRWCVKVVFRDGSEKDYFITVSEKK